VLIASAVFPGHDTDGVGVFGGPMAHAIIGGVFVATLLTLLLLSALYIACIRIKEPAKERQMGVRERAPGAWPGREP
jgi:hypothetical protein